MATTPSTRPQPSTGWVSVRPPMSAICCVPLTWAMWPTAKKIADLVRLMHGHVQQAGEIGERAAHAEGEHDDAHVLDRGIGEHPFDVAPAVEHEGGEHERDEAHRHHQRAGRERRRVDGQQHLEAQQRIERDIEQQAREHRRDRRRAFGVGVGQPGMQRRQPDLGAVAEQQEHEGDVEQRRIELRRVRDQHGPHHGVEALADHRPRRHVDEDGAEQRQRDADAAEDEIFPGRFERLVGAVDADHQHGGQRRQLDRDPHQADIVGDQREVHARTSAPDTWRDRSAGKPASAGRSRARGRYSWR